MASMANGGPPEAAGRAAARPQAGGRAGSLRVPWRGHGLVATLTLALLLAAGAVGAYWRDAFALGLLAAIASLGAAMNLMRRPLRGNRVADAGGHEPTRSRESGAPDPGANTGNVISFDDPFVRHRARVRRLRVLAWLSEPQVLRTADAMLERAGHAMVQVGHGGAVLEMLRRDAFDAVLIDAGGLETMQQVRLLEDAATRTPFIVIGHADGADTDAAPEGDACTWLETPLAAAGLLDALAAIGMRGDSGERGPAITIEQGALASRMLDELFDLSLGPDFMKLFIRECIHDAVQCIAEIERHGESGDWPAYRDACAALRGVASNVGAIKLADCAASAMQPSDRELPRAWRAAIAALREQFEAARTALQVAAADPALDRRGSL